MNQREKLQAQLDLLQEIKNQFFKGCLFIPQGEDYASVQIDRNDKSELRVYADFNQKKFEEDIDSQIEAFFNDYINETENNIEEEIEKESFAFANSMELVKRRISLESDNLPNI